MSKSVKGTKTEKNLLAAFAGESQARNRYTYFASAAKKRVLSRSPIFLLRPLKMKKSTPRFSLSIWKVEMLKS